MSMIIVVVQTVGSIRVSTHKFAAPQNFLTFTQLVNSVSKSLSLSFCLTIALPKMTCPIFIYGSLLSGPVIDFQSHSKYFSRPHWSLNLDSCTRVTLVQAGQ